MLSPTRWSISSTPLWAIVRRCRSPRCCWAAATLTTLPLDPPRDPVHVPVRDPDHRDRGGLGAAQGRRRHAGGVASRRRRRAGPRSRRARAAALSGPRARASGCAGRCGTATCRQISISDQHRRIAPRLMQLGHVLEVHPVDAGDRRRHRRDRHPRRDLAHVDVLLHRDLAERGLHQRAEHLVVAGDPVGGLGVVVAARRADSAGPRWRSGRCGRCRIRCSASVSGLTARRSSTTSRLSR